MYLILVKNALLRYCVNCVCYGCLTIPVVILFEKGKELRRITSAVHSEEDIYRFVTGE